MLKFLIEFELDGYDTEEEKISACIEFMREQLDFSASYVGKIEVVKDDELDKLCPRSLFGEAKDF